jgi:hypothetical protein
MFLASNVCSTTGLPCHTCRVIAAPHEGHLTPEHGTPT